MHYISDIMKCEEPICPNLLSVREQQIADEGRIASLSDRYTSLECLVSCIKKEVDGLKVVEAKLGYIASEIDDLKESGRDLGGLIKEMKDQQTKFVESHAGDVGYILTFISIAITLFAGFIAWLFTYLIPRL